MIRTVPDYVWAFDLEWVPDVASGRRAYDLPADMPDADVYEVMWARGGATPEEPRPYLKTMLCRVVSVAAMTRKAHEDGRVTLALSSLPAGEPLAERLIGRFLGRLGEAHPRPQLVGFNSRSSDLPILIQRGIALGVTAPGFCHRPARPWDGYDYFSNKSEGHIDLKEVVSGWWGKATPSLHEFACACGIPGKIGTSGDNVIELWLAGDVRRIVEYNQCDALTTYLVWLRTALFAGLLSCEAHAEEEGRVRDLLARRAEAGEAHLGLYLAKWEGMTP